MNLWVKRTGQLLLAALFLMSCADDSFLLGFRNQNKKFSVGYQEFLLDDITGSTLSEIIAIDSVITDNYSGTSRLLVGEYIDPLVGTVRTESFVEFLPVSTVKLNQSASLGYVFDSLVFQLRLDYYSYGLVDQGTSNFKIHRITEDTISYRKAVTLKVKNKAGQLVDSVFFINGAKRYYTNSTIGYNEAEFLGETKLYRLNKRNGEEKLTSIALKLNRLEAGQDTLVAAARLDDAFGLALFNTAKDDINSEFSDYEKFRTRYKGMALIPSESNAVLGYHTGNTLSKLTLYYHTTENPDGTGNVKDTLIRAFFPGASFHNITPTRTAELPSPDPAYVGTAPGSGTRVVQSGNPLITKIDLSKFYTQFTDTIKDKIIINSAELLVQSAPSEDGYKAISNLELRVMKENDSYLDYRIEDDSTFASGNFLLTSGNHYFVIGDVSESPAILSYSSSKEKYSGFATYFFQTLLDRVQNNKENPGSPKPLIRYLGLYPAGELGKSINRTVFNKSNIKLRIYYTYPNKTNL